MTARLLIVFLFYISPRFSRACLDADQFKIYPVGVVNDQIITVDLKIFRTMRRRVIPSKDSLSGMTLEWRLWPYISIYDKNQKLISSTALGVSITYGNTYTDTLQHIYTRAVQDILLKFKGIELFSPYQISFCNFQKKCKSIELINDGIAEKDFLKLYNKKYLLHIIKDETYFGFKASRHIPNSISKYISSVRIYKTKSLELVIVHLSSGEEISLERKQEGRHNPDVLFKDIKNCVYQEPLPHHGYGFDVFVVK